MIQGAAKPPTTIVQPKKVPFKIQSLQKRQNWFKMLFYGANGSGKTEMLGTGAELSDFCDMFIINAEKGTMTISETDRISDTAKAHVFTIDVDTISEVESIRQWLVAHCAARDANDEAKLRELEVKVGFREEGDTHPARRFRSVGIDSLTEIQAFGMTQVLGITNALAFDASIPDSEWSHYNKILNRMQMVMRAFRDLPMHVIFLCQEDYKQDQTKKMLFSPQLMGKMGGRVQGFVDVAGRFEVVSGEQGKSVHRLFIKPVERSAAKNRFGKLKAAFVDNPTIPLLIEGLETGKTNLIKDDAANEGSFAPPEADPVEVE